MRRLSGWAVLAAGASAAAAIGASRRLALLRPALERVAPEFRAAAALSWRPYSPTLPRRGGWADRAMRTLSPRGLGQLISMPATHGRPAIPAFTYDPPGRTRPSGAVVWIHGGGFIGGHPAQDHALASRIAREAGVLVVSPDYRLAPEHPFPEGMEDCFATLAWLHEQADELGIDPERVAVAGGSAGGGLAAVTAQWAHDQGLAVSFQALLYPMLDDRTPLRADDADRGTFVWTPEDNRDAWAWYLGHPASDPEPRAYASASGRTDLTGLPAAWIGVGDIDLFYEEDLAYARRLEAAGVSVETHVVAGMPHAADYLAWVSAARGIRTSLISALRRGTS